MSLRNIGGGPGLLVVCVLGFALLMTQEPPFYDPVGAGLAYAAAGVAVLFCVVQAGR